MAEPKAKASPKNELAHAILEDLVKDLNGRKGISLDDLDIDVAEEIRSKWLGIITKHLTK